MINVLIVDDSAFMRNTLSNMISEDPDIKVVGIARNGMEAVEKVAQLKPDIVTLDIEMPVKEPGPCPDGQFADYRRCRDNA